MQSTSSQPYAIMMVGLPGSGRSFFASQFSETFGAPHIDATEISRYCKDEQAAQALTLHLLNELAKTGTSFIYEGDTGSRVRRTEFSRWARQHGRQPLIVWVQTDLATARQRSMKNKHISREVFDYQVKHFSEPHPSELQVVISGKHTYASQARGVLGVLGRTHQRVVESHTNTPRGHIHSERSRTE